MFKGGAKVPLLPNAPKRPADRAAPLPVAGLPAWEAAQAVQAEVCSELAVGKAVSAPAGCSSSH